MSPRIERDALGEKEIPDDAYYGVQTQRAVENFPISGRTAHPELIIATVQIKKAAAQGGLAGSNLAGQQDETAVTLDPILQMCERLAVMLAHVKIERIRRDRKGVLIEAEI